MPFTFVQVEERKTRVISAVFAFTILFYFLTAYLVVLVLNISLGAQFSSSGSSRVFWPTGSQALIAFLVAFLGAFLHWAVSVSNLIPKLSLSLGAAPGDPQDTYHKVFANIVDEVSVAIGGRKIEPMVVPTAALNAFALEDFQGRAVIGVTEGLLTRLNRSQLEAVVGHEAGHIINGDCLSTTVTCSLAEIYDEAIARLSTGAKRVRGRAGLLIFLLFVVIGLMRFFSMLVRYFISREKEYRADATAVRLTRDPLSLAEALTLISRNWRGSGIQGEKLESIFIMSPNYNPLDDRDGLVADAFTTHPPVRERVKVLTGMAHLDPAAMEEHLKKKPWVSPVAKAEVAISAAPVGDKKWFVFSEQKWTGPFGLDELMGLSALTPDQWIRRDGQDAVRHAYEDVDVMKIFLKEAGQASQEAAEGVTCPHCRVPLSAINYEGAPALKCGRCEGIFVTNDKIGRVFFRRDMVFSEETIKRAELIMKQRDSFKDGPRRLDPANSWALSCPLCHNKMRRQFFVYSYPVEVDRCISCDGLWLDKGEIELLQYIYEHKEKFFKSGDL